MEKTCHRCSTDTFVIFEDKPWCRAHFLAEVQQREARSGDAEPGGRSVSFVG